MCVIKLAREEIATEESLLAMAAGVAASVGCTPDEWPVTLVVEGTKVTHTLPKRLLEAAQQKGDLSNFFVGVIKKLCRDCTIPGPVTPQRIGFLSTDSRW